MNINDIKLGDLLDRGFKLECEGMRKNDVGELEPDPHTFICTKDSLYVDKFLGVVTVHLDVDDMNGNAFMQIKGLYSLEDLINLHRLIHVR